VTSSIERFFLRHGYTTQEIARMDPDERVRTMEALLQRNGSNGAVSAGDRSQSIRADRGPPPAAPRSAPPRHPGMARQTASPGVAKSPQAHPEVAPVESSIVLPYRVKVVVTERPAATKEAPKLIIPKIKVGGRAAITSRRRIPTKNGRKRLRMRLYVASPSRKSL
jgi:hypothetical protein